jgi:hypothetical protein
MVREKSNMAMDVSLTTLKEQKRLFDDLWLLTLFVVLLAMGVPWFLRVLEINFARMAWSLFLYGICFIAVSTAANRLERRRSLLAVIAIQQACGVLFIAYLWHLSGGLQNPMFLLVFTMPLLAGSLILRSLQSYPIAALALLSVVAVALRDAPELSWYLARIGVLPPSIAGHFSNPSTYSSGPFPGLSLTPAFSLVVLLIFAAMIFIVAVTSEYLREVLLRLFGRLASSAAVREEAEGLFLDVLRASPAPVALIYADTLNVAHASQSFLHEFFLSPDLLLEKNLLGLVDFLYPEVVEELIRGKGGEASIAPYRLGSEIRLSRIIVHPIQSAGNPYAYINFQDVSDLHYMQTALGVLEQALLVISPGRQVLYFNHAAQDLFSGLRLGVDAAILLQQPSLPTGWWELRNRTRQVRQVEFGGQHFRATCTASPILGGRNLLTVLNLHPMAGEA